MAEVTGMTPDRIAQEITNATNNLSSQVDTELSKKADNTYVENFAEEVGKDIEVVQNKTKPLDVTRENSFAVLDENNRSALSVNPDGSTTIGSTLMDDNDPGIRVLDLDDRVAFEITGGGKTIINDLVGGGGSTGVTELHAFVCAGQSNMSGRGDPIDPMLDVENPRLLQYGAKNRTLEPAPAILDMMDTPIGLSPARQFGLRYLADQPDHVGVLLITAAYGGTGFTYEPTPGRKTWTKGHADVPENALYENALQQSQEALSQAEVAGYSVKLQGLLWHQGEANGSSLPQNMQSYAEQLDGLINNFRVDLDAPNLPVIVGEMMPEGMRDSVAKRSIGYIHAQTPERVQRVAFAPAPDNTMRHNDFAHFSREGAVLLGDSFFESWPRAVLNVPTGKPRAARDVAAYRVGDQVTVSWSAPTCRVTSYVVEWASAPDGSWQEVSREWPMNLSETFTAHDAPVWVRITAYEDSNPATPSHPLPALGA